MAQDLAATIAITIQKNFGTSLDHKIAELWTAKAAPVKAKGKANTECSNRIISSVIRNRFPKLVGATNGWVLKSFAFPVTILVDAMDSLPFDKRLCLARMPA
jgi:hypothetical protein